MSGDAPEELEVVERYEISDDEDDFEYGTIDDEENLGLDDEDDDDEDLATALASLAKTKDASATVSPTKTTETRDTDTQPVCRCSRAPLGSPGADPPRPPAIVQRERGEDQGGAGGAAEGH